jgi:hypothetical protein
VPSCGPRWRLAAWRYHWPDGPRGPEPGVSQAAHMTS